MHVLRSIALAAAVTAAGATPASASTRPVDRVAAGPVLAGGAVAWAAPAGATLRGQTIRVFRATGPAGRAEQIASHAPSDDATLVRTGGLSASADGFALTVHEAFAAGGGRTVVTAGAFGSAPRPRSDGCSEGSADVDAGRVLVATCRARVEELAGVVEPRELTSYPTSAALAGRFAAWVDRTFQLTVHDLGTGTEVLRLRGGRSLAAFDVGDDGTVVLVRRINGVARLEVASPANPELRTLPGTRARAGTTRVRVHGGRVAYQRQVTSSARTTIGVYDLRSDHTAIVTRRALLRDAGSFDFDGSTVAWLDRRRGRLLIRTAPVPAAAR